MAYEYIGCLGSGFRKGVDPSTKLTPLVLSGYILASLVQYTVFAPIYWYRLYRVRHPKLKTTRPENKKERFKKEPSVYRFITDLPYEDRISKYSMEELQAIQRSINKDRFPERYTLVEKEIQKREEGA